MATVRVAVAAAAVSLLAAAAAAAAALEVSVSVVPAGGKAWRGASSWVTRWRLSREWRRWR